MNEKYISDTNYDDKIKFPSPIFISRRNSTCGSCGQFTALMGSPDEQVEMAAFAMNNRQFTESRDYSTSVSAVEFIPIDGFETINGFASRRDASFLANGDT